MNLHKLSLGPSEAAAMMAWLKKSMGTHILSATKMWGWASRANSWAWPPMFHLRRLKNLGPQGPASPFRSQALALGCRSSQEPGRAWRSQEQPEGAESQDKHRSSQEQPGGARSSQEEPGAARRTREDPGARGSQEEPGGAMSQQKSQEPGGVTPMRL